MRSRGVGVLVRPSYGGKTKKFLYFRLSPVRDSGTTDAPDAEEKNVPLRLTSSALAVTTPSHLYYHLSQPSYLSSVYYRTPRSTLQSLKLPQKLL